MGARESDWRRCPEPKPVFIVILALAGGLGGLISECLFDPASRAEIFRQLGHGQWVHAISNAIAGLAAGAAAGLSVALVRPTWARLLLTPLTQAAVASVSWFAVFSLLGLKRGPYPMWEGWMNEGWVRLASELPLGLAMVGAWIAAARSPQWKFPGAPWVQRWAVWMLGAVAASLGQFLIVQILQWARGPVFSPINYEETKPWYTILPMVVFFSVALLGSCLARRIDLRQRVAAPIKPN